MGTLSLTNFVTGADILASGHNSNNSALLAAINGGLDTANWNTGKIFHPNKVLQDGASNGQALVWDGTDWSPANVSASPRAWAFLTASGSATTTSTSSATAADIDAVNFVMTFLAPSAGNVLVELNGLCRMSTSSASVSSDNNYIWNIRDSGGDVSGTEQVVRQFVNPSASATQEWQICHARIFVSGLVGGNSYTWKWGHRRTTTTGIGTATGSIKYGTGNGFASMTVWPIGN